jgi:ubiquinone/menaquinone biosynthesis C-methylase UbiE
MTKVDYDAISRVYDDVRRADVDLINSFAEEIDLNPAARVLDLGCGTGNHTDALQQITRAQVCGVEPSTGMIDKARQKNPAIDFRAGEAAQIPFEDAAFDFIYMTDVIHHVPDIDVLFGEVARVLRPGGKLCVVTQSHDQIARRAIAQFFPGTVAVDQARYPDIDQITQAAEARGLRALKTATLYEGGELTLDARYLELVRKKGYSMLHLITDDEYATGLRKLEAALGHGPITLPTAGETLVWIGKNLVK